MTSTLPVSPDPRPCIALVNLSSDPRVTPDAVAKLARALDAHNFLFSTIWGQSYRASFRVATSLDDVNEREWPLRIVDTTGIDDALAFHDEEGDKPALVAEVLSEADANGSTLFKGSESLSVAAAHEVGEAMRNPFVNDWIDLPSENGDQVPAETVDPVQGDTFAVPTQDGGTPIDMPNFVTPAWFNPNAAVGVRFDYLGNVRAPFQVHDQGYVSIRHADGSIDTQFGAKVSESRKARVLQRGRIARRARARIR